jgi:hypothetical protein
MPTYTDPVSSFQDVYNNQGLAGLTFGNGERVPPTSFSFAPGTTPLYQQQIKDAATQWDWAPATPQPDPEQFLENCANDSSLNSVYPVLMPFEYSIKRYVLNPSAVKAAWQQIIAGGQLSSDQISTIEGYATAANVPLV